MGQFSKQSSSRPIKYQVLAYNSASIGSTNFGPSVQQVRIMSQLGGWIIGRGKFFIAIEEPPAQWLVRTLEY